MIPGDGEYLSFLMGAPRISDAELERLGVEILRGAGTPLRGLRVPAGALGAYKELIREKLEPGFWNDLVGRAEILFLFKPRAGDVAELAYCEENRESIARMCSELNGDPLEKTSDIPRYLAGNPFYRDAMVACHGVVAGAVDRA